MLARLGVLIFIVAAASVSRCGRTEPRVPSGPPRMGDHVRLRGTLGEDVDCRVFRVEGGDVYSLSARLRGYANGSRICIEGTISESGQCMQSPMIEVQYVRAWDSCP